MKTYYRVQMMTEENYNEMMRGNLWYHVDHIDVLAESTEEAIEMAQKMEPDMRINKHWVKTLAELEEEKKLAEERRETDRAKEEARKEKRLANEMAKAEAEGLTLAEYRAKRNHERKIRTAEREVEDLKEKLAEAEKRLEELKKRG